MPNDSKSIRWGVIGCGQIAVDKSIPGLLAAKGALLAAIADPLEPRRALALDLAAKNGQQPKTYSDIDDLLADPEIDAVYRHAQGCGDRRRHCEKGNSLRKTAW